MAARAAYLELAGVTAGSRAREVGCGSGAVTRAVARLVGPAGRVVGLDPSPGLRAVAAELEAVRVRASTPVERDPDRRAR